MPVYDVTIVGKAYLPEVGGGPIIPPGGGGGPVPPLGIWGPTDPRPTPPIYIQIPPGSVDGEHPEHPIYIPVYPAHPIVIPPDAIGPGVPSHPIYLPPGIWGPNDPRPQPPIFIPPDAISPGVPSHPIYLPPVVSPPIFYPPGTAPGDPRPEHPIVIPPEGGGAPPAGSNWTWGWNAASGWHPVFVPEGGKPQPVPPPGGEGETPPTDPDEPHVEPHKA